MDEPRGTAERSMGTLQIAIAVLVGALYVFEVIGPVARPELFVSILVLGAGWASWNLFGRRQLAPNLPWDLTSCTFKAALIGVVLHSTGGISSPLLGLLYFGVVGVAMRNRALWTVFGSGLIYSAALVALVLLTGPDAASLTALAVNVALLLSTAFAAAHLADRAIRLRVEEALRKRRLNDILSAQDSERRSLARELHDGTGQALASLAVRLKLLEETSADPAATCSQARDLRSIAEACIDDIVRLSRGLHPAALEELGFAPAVDRLVTEHGAAHAMGADSIVRGFDTTPPLPITVATALYRILQEALRNVAQHAGARSVSVVVDRSASGVRMIVEDDGAGFAPDGSSGRGLGLESIRERVGLLGGQVAIDSGLGQGTTLAVDIPLAANSPHTPAAPALQA